MCAYILIYFISLINLQCLNVLVAAGAAGADSKQLSSYKAIHSCACSPGDTRVSLLIFMVSAIKSLHVYLFVLCSSIFVKN